MSQSVSRLKSTIYIDVESKYFSFAFYRCLLLETVTGGLFVCLLLRGLKGKSGAVKKKWRECVGESLKNSVFKKEVKVNLRSCKQQQVMCVKCRKTIINTKKCTDMIENMEEIR